MSAKIQEFFKKISLPADKFENLSASGLFRFWLGHLWPNTIFLKKLKFFAKRGKI